MRHKFQGIQETQKSVKNSYYIAPLISTQSKFSQYSYIPTLTSVRCQWAEVFQISELSGLTVFYQDDHGGFCLQVTDIFKGQVSFDSFNYLLWGRNHWGYPNSLILIAKVIVQHSGSVYWTKIFHKLCSLTQPICWNNVKDFFAKKEACSSQYILFVNNCYLTVSYFSFSSRDKKVVKYMECVKGVIWLRIYWNEGKFL